MQHCELSSAERSVRSGPESLAISTAYLAALLLVTGEDVVREAPEGLLLWLLVGVAAAAGIWSMQQSRKTAYPYVEFRPLLMTLFFVHYALGGVMIAFWNYLPWTLSANQNVFTTHGVRSNLSRAAYLAILGCLGLFCGSSINIRERHRPALRDAREVSRLRAMTPAVLVITFFVYLIVEPYVSKDWKQPVEVAASFGQVLLAFSAYAAASSKGAEDRTRWWITCGVSCALLAIPSLRDGMREHFIKPPLIVLVGYVAARRRVPWKACFLSFAAFVLIALPILNVAKQYALEGNTNSLDRMQNALLDSAESQIASKENVFVNVLVRTNLLSMVAIYSQAFPAQYSWLAGESFRLELVDFMPRPLWPDKPETGRILDGYARQVGIIGSTDLVTSAKFDALSEYYINFGPLGVFVLAWCHGFFYRLLETGFRRFTSSLVSVLAICVIMIQNNDFFGFVVLSSTHVHQLFIWSAIVFMIRADNRRRRPLTIFARAYSLRATQGDETRGEISEITCTTRRKAIVA